METAETALPRKPPRGWALLLCLLYAGAVAVGLTQILRKGERPWLGRAKQPVVAVISINGVISSSNRGLQPTDTLMKRLKSLSERDDVKAVVLRINSPGGSVGAVQELYEEIVRLRKSGKKVVASISDIAASGGYYLASASDKIYAEPGSLTGSIGVILEVGNVQELLKKIGMKMEAVKSAEHKDIASPFRTMTEEERNILKSIVDDAYGQFLQAVCDGRHMDRQKLLPLADGRVFTGAQAKANGLVDELGNGEDAIAKAAQLAGIKGKPKVIYAEDPLEKFFSAFSEDSRVKFWEETASRSGVRLAYLWECAL